MSTSYECALSGLESEPGMNDDSDGLGDLPVGWTRIVWSRRSYNPKWIRIQQVKEMKTQAILSQVPETERPKQEPLVRIQLDAEFYGLESSTPMYLTDEDVVFISDSGDIVAAINEVRGQLGMEALVYDEDGDEEEDGSEAKAVEDAVEKELNSAEKEGT